MAQEKIIRKRVVLSLLAIRTQRLYLIILFAIATTLFILHLFLLNHLAMQGYLLTHEMKFNKELGQEVEQIEARMARANTRAFLGKQQARSLPMVMQEPQSRFVVIPAAELTAQK